MDTQNLIYRGALNAIYFKLNTAFLKNDRNTADYLLDVIESEIKDEPWKLRGEIGYKHFNRYEKIKERILNKEYGRIYGSGYSSTFDQNSNLFIPPNELKEVEFHKKLIEGRKHLFYLLGLGYFADMYHEYDVYPYGRCDFLIRKDRAWFMVEVKMGEAPTSVVSQIDKYLVAGELDMCLGLHDEVFSVVIAENFNEYVFSELSRMSCIMIKHKGDVENLHIMKNNKNVSASLAEIGF